MLSPGASDASVVHVSVPPRIWHLLSNAEAMVFAGIGSVTTTPDGSVEGPLFFNVMVYVVDVPAVTSSVPSSFMSERSALVVTASVSEALSLPLDGSTICALLIDAVFVSVTPE